MYMFISSSKPSPQISDAAYLQSARIHDTNKKNMFTGVTAVEFVAVSLFLSFFVFGVVFLLFFFPLRKALILTNNMKH